MAVDERIASMSKLTKIELSKLPRNIMYAEDGNTFMMTMNRACTSANMQGNKAAFEAWALFARTHGYSRVVLSESDCTRTLSAAEKLHYHRFLYRAYRFEKGFDWFTLSGDLMKKAENFENTELSREDLFVNAPIIEAATKTESPEAKMERLLVKDEYLDYLNSLFRLNLPKYYNQLPVGLFGGCVTSKTAIFPRSHAAIDIWGLDESTFHFIELKVKKNQNLGILSEVFFYACYIHDMYCRKRLAQNKDLEYERKYPVKLRGYNELINANADNVVAHILTQQKHPRLDAAFAELQGCRLDGIRFADAVSYSLKELGMVTE